MTNPLKVRDVRMTRPACLIHRSLLLCCGLPSFTGAPLIHRARLIHTVPLPPHSQVFLIWVLGMFMGAMTAFALTGEFGGPRIIAM